MSAITERLSAAVAGRYRIERHLGEGGMATVYLAFDVKHDRKVALKVLKPELAAVLGAERFVQEIKTTASLQHPHILPLFDSGTADGFLFYVMPFVEGETLRDKINRETQLSIDEAVQIASSVADALDYAHRHGVIHRDIKPENILMHDGRPVVADFGIALAVSAAAGGRMTETGLSLGTPHYMSPEQATAEKELTGRSDVYSLGCVLYELLTGSPPHVGATAQQIIMKIVTEDAAPVTRARKSVPPNVAAAIAKSLEKLPADRFATAAQFRDALANASFAPTASTQSAVSAAVVAGQRRYVLPLVFATPVLLIAALWGWLRPAPVVPVLRYEVGTVPVAVTPAGTPVPTPSPDGSFLVYAGPMPDSRPGSMLWLKRREHHAATPIPGTTAAQTFAISPDREWIAFTSGSQLKKIPVSGGTAVTLVAALVAPMWGVAWVDDETIVYGHSPGFPGLARISPSGGEPDTIARSDGVPEAIPEPIAGTRSILFARCTSQTSCNLWARNLDTDEAKQLIPGVTWAQYAPSGHIVYGSDGRLMAVEFDAKRLEIRGQPVALADSLDMQQVYPLRIGRSGTLVSRVGSGSNLSGLYQMVWVDRAGRETPVDTAWRLRVTVTANNHGWALSPNGNQLAIGGNTDAGDDIWVKELPRGAFSRVSFDPAPDFRPRWTADGQSITFISQRSTLGVYKRRADAAGADTLVLPGLFDEAFPARDGAWVFLRHGANNAAAGGRDLTAIRTGKDTTRKQVVVSSFDEEAIAPSPDTKLIAYQSDETGQNEVFVRPFPNTDGFKRQVSNNGGQAPLWSRDGRELFYLAGNMMMSVRLTPGAQVTFSEPKAMFRVPDDLLFVESAYYTPWDVAADGRFIMARLLRESAATPPKIVVAENWLSELRAKMKR